MSHASSDAAASADRKGRDPSSAAPCADSQRWAADPRRLDAHRRAARTVAQAASATSSQQLVAKSIGLELRSFQKLCDPDDRKRMPLADVFAARDDFKRSIAVALLATCEEAQPAPEVAPSVHAMRIASAFGEVTERIDDAEQDGEVSPEEARSILRSLHKLGERVERLSQRIRQHMGDA